MKKIMAYTTKRPTFTKHTSAQGIQILIGPKTQQLGVKALSIRIFILLSASIATTACTSNPKLPDQSSYALRVAKPAFWTVGDSLSDSELNIEEMRRFKAARQMVSDGLTLGAGIAMAGTSGAIFGTLGIVGSFQSDHTFASWFMSWESDDTSDKSTARANLERVMNEGMRKHHNTAYHVRPRRFATIGNDPENEKFKKNGLEFIGPSCPRPDGTICFLYPNVAWGNQVKVNAVPEMGGGKMIASRGQFLSGRFAATPENAITDEGLLAFARDLPRNHYYYLGPYDGNRMKLPKMLIGWTGDHYFVKDTH